MVILSVKKGRLEKTGDETKKEKSKRLASAHLVERVIGK